MANILYSIIGIVSIVVLGFIYSQNLRYAVNEKRQKCFGMLLICAAIFCVVDVYWGMVASGWILDSSYLQMASTLFYAFSSFAAMAWVHFVIYYSGASSVLRHGNTIYVCASFPLVAVVALLYINWDTGVIFYVDEMGNYCRGLDSYVNAMYSIHALFYVFALAITAFAIRNRAKTHATINHAVLFFSIIPIIAGILQRFAPFMPCYTIGYMLACLVVFIFDVLEDREQLISEKQQRNQKMILDSCTEVLYGDNSSGDNIDSLLKILGEYYDADRAYIFEYSKKKDYIDNSYEWCKEGIAAEIDNLQCVPAQVADTWVESFRERGDFYIADLARDVDRNSDLYAILAPQGIKSIVATPLLVGGNIIGFIGVDNPTKSVGDLTVIRVISIFIISEIHRRKHEELEEQEKQELIKKQRKELREQKKLLNNAIEMAKDAQREGQIDKLTGLYNKVAGLEAVERFLKVKGRKERYTMMFMDVDKFKDINDTYGHLIGDEILEAVGTAIHKVFPDDITIRFGGDEFMVLLKRVGSTFEAENRAEILRSELRTICRDKDYSFTCSIGMYVTTTGDYEVAMDHADKALYHVKRFSRDSVKVYEEE